jgi:bifunctional non-homologous end joining protein LigD
VPIARGPAYESTRAFARAVADALERSLPRLVSARTGDRTERRVVVDWRQNHTGASVAAPYSVRAGRGAHVSCPLAWHEVEDGYAPFGMKDVAQRVAALGDLYAAALTGEQRLPL